MQFSEDAYMLIWNSCNSVESNFCNSEKTGQSSGMMLLSPRNCCLKYLKNIKYSSFIEDNMLHSIYLLNFIIFHFSCNTGNYLDKRCIFLLSTHEVHTTPRSFNQFPNHQVLSINGYQHSRGSLLTRQGTEFVTKPCLEAMTRTQVPKR